MGQFDGKVAFVTGAGRGQGREHARRIAAEGAAVAIVDLGDAAQVTNPDYRTATAAELAETQRLIEDAGGRALAFEADVRNFDALADAAAATVAEFGGLDFVVANAGIIDQFNPVWDIPLENWQTVLGINLTGVFHTCKATVPHVRKRGPGGSIVLISSAVALKPYGYIASYYVAKVGVRALMLSLAKELGPDLIRCNSVHPGSIMTDMAHEVARLNERDAANHREQFNDAKLMPVELEERDTAAAVVWLLSDEARHITGLEMCVDAGESKS